MTETRDIPFRNLPGQSRLFLEYLDLAPGALRFYQRPPTLAAVATMARDELPRVRFPRAEMQSVLERQNAALGAGERTREHIRLLGKEGCATVVTGQQVGLFSGPLYTIYKALAAIRLAEALRSEGIPTVPVFWMECEDHDLAEVTHGSVIGRDGALRSLSYRSRLYGDAHESLKPVGTLALPESILDITAEYAESLQEGPYTEEIRSLLETSYRPGAGFADAFGILMARLFSGHGLVLFNPGDRDVKRLVAPLFRAVLQRPGEIRKHLEDRSRELEAAGFHSQVSILENSTVVFFLENNARRAVTWNDSRFGLKNLYHSWPAEELLELAGRSPERFSPSVLLRPLVQDHLFPTAAYVGGPAEVAYFAQIEVLYRLLDRPMPAIWPRASFTLFEPDIRAAIRESGLELTDCFQSRQNLIEKIAERTTHSGASAQVRSLGEELDRVLSEIRPELVLAEASLGPALDTARRKIQHNINALHAKLIQLEAERSGTIARRADLILNHCYPNRNLQERELGAPVFLARQGLQLLDELYSAVQPGTFAHRLVALQEVRRV